MKEENGRRNDDEMEKGQGNGYSRKANGRD